MTADQWLLLALRLALALLLYLFLLWVVRALRADLRAGAPVATTSPAPAPAIRLVLLDAASGGSPAAGLTLPLAAVTTVGRAGDNALVLDDEFVSAHHAVLRRQNGAWWLSDAGSTNGTWANDRRVERRPIAVGPGDTLRFGRLRARLET